MLTVKKNSNVYLLHFYFTNISHFKLNVNSIKELWK